MPCCTGQVYEAHGTERRSAPTACLLRTGHGHWPARRLRLICLNDSRLEAKMIINRLKAPVRLLSWGGLGRDFTGGGGLRSWPPPIENAHALLPLISTRSSSARNDAAPLPASPGRWMVTPASSSATATGRRSLVSTTRKSPGRRACRSAPASSTARRS